MALIEVVIGLVFVFSLLAILVTQINAFIASALRLRARELKQGIISLVGDKHMQAELLIHPLVNMVDRSNLALLSLRVNDDDIADQILESDTPYVTQIDASTFTEALMSILVVRAASDMYDPLRRAIDAMPAGPPKDYLRGLFFELQANLGDIKLRQMRSTILSLPDNQALLDALNRTETLYNSIRFRSAELAPLLAGARNIRTPAFRNALEALLATAEDLNDARQKLENWFNDGMARTSAIYQGRMQIISFIVGLALVVVLNVDTLLIGRTLWEDQALRQAVAAAALTFEPPATPPPATLPPDDLGGLDSLEAQAALAEVQANLQQVQQTVQQLLDLRLPIGWEHVPVTAEMLETSAALGLPDPRGSARNLWNYWPGNNPDWLGMTLQKLIGWLISAVAAAKGAPFWFDLLNKIARRGG